MLPLVARCQRGKVPGPATASVPDLQPWHNQRVPRGPLAETLSVPRTKSSGPRPSVALPNVCPQQPCLPAGR